MLVQAQGREAQAARGFWGVPGKKKSKIAAGSWRGAAQAAGGPPAGLKRAWGSDKNRPKCWCRLKVVRHREQGASGGTQAKQSRNLLLAAGEEQHRQEVGL